tara:strand:- start:34 stop:501 length:468 start_codon:yes stop_codon:yes gene_type:complete
MSKRYMKTIHLIEEFPESERVKKSDGRMYQCIGKDSYDDMCQPFDHWIEHPMVVHYDGKIIKHCPGCLLGNYYYPEDKDNAMDWSKGDLPKQEYTVWGTLTTSVEMGKIKAVSKEHAIEIFKLGWEDQLLDPELELDEKTIGAEANSEPADSVNK